MFDVFLILTFRIFNFMGMLEWTFWELLTKLEYQRRCRNGGDSHKFSSGPVDAWVPGKHLRAFACKGATKMAGWRYKFVY